MDVIHNLSTIYMSGDIYAYKYIFHRSVSENSQNVNSTSDSVTFEGGVDFLFCNGTIKMLQ